MFEPIPLSREQVWGLQLKQYLQTKDPASFDFVVDNERGDYYRVIGGQAVREDLVANFVDEMLLDQSPESGLEGKPANPLEPEFFTAGREFPDANLGGAQSASAGRQYPSGASTFAANTASKYD
ncbi:hypothetical protein JW978_04090 [Candidatus Dojkabacteria bacterium]|nr:hypothetical protein [Candidatus Dojkabacteria bacterium]